MRAIQGHSGGNKDDLSLQDNVEIAYNWVEDIEHTGFRSGAGGKEFNRRTANRIFHCSGYLERISKITIKKVTNRGARHGRSEEQRAYHQARDCLKKGAQ